MEKSKLRKEIEKSPLLFGMGRLKFLNRLMSLQLEIDEKDLTKDDKEYREWTKYKSMDTRYMIESGLIGYEVKQRVDKIIDKCITDLLEGNNE